MHDRERELSTSDEAVLVERLTELVKKRPLVALAGAGAIGALLGGVFLSRLGRLVFIAAAGYVANELWHREGRLDIQEVIENLRRGSSR